MNQQVVKPQLVQQPPEPKEPTRAPESFGPYTLVRELGRGGQAVVFLADDSRLERQVALKIYVDPALRGLLKATPHVLERFQREARAASRLNHPGICTIFEAGEVDGVPYLAMEYVDGTPLTEVARRNRGEWRRIVEWVEETARALHVAHEHGLVHRDMKPGNVLITADGRAVIVDFGLVRDLDSDDSALTRSTDVVGTPIYMPPEQIRSRSAKLDQRGDVYSLAVTLFQALTSRAPFDAATREALYHSILNDSPPDPRRWNSELPRDLKTVLDVALEKEPDRRYQTAVDFADDLRRVRLREPVAARPVGPVVRVRRWAERNPMMAALLVVVFALLAGGLGWTVHKNAQLAHERDVATRRLERSEAVTTFLEEMFLALEPRRDGRDARVIDVLERAEPKLETAFGEQPLVQAALRDAVGVAYESLGLYDRARRHLERSLELRREASAESYEIAESYYHLADVLGRQSEYAGAERAIDRALELEEEFYGVGSLQTLPTLARRGWIYRETGRLDEAVEIHSRVLELSRRLLGGDSPTTVGYLRTLSTSCMQQGDFERAEALLTEALEISGRDRNEDVLERSDFQRHLASLYHEKGRFPEAESLLRQALATLRRRLSADHPDIAAVLGSLATVLGEQGAHREARTHCEESLRILRQAHRGPNHEVFRCLKHLAAIELNLQQADTARTLLVEALEMGKEVFDGPHRDVAECLDALAIVSQWQGRNDDAEKYHKQALEAFRECFSGDHPSLATNLFNLGIFYQRVRDDLATSERYLRQALAMERSLRGADNYLVATVEYEIAGVLKRQGKAYGEAASLAEHAATVFEKTYGDADRHTALTLYLLAVLRLDLGEPEGAESAASRALAAWEKVEPTEARQLNKTRALLGRCLETLSRWEEAEEHLLRAHEFFRENEGPGGAHSRRIASLLVDLYEKTGDAAAAESYRDTLDETVDNALESNSLPDESRR